jgi:hypothetical protein
MEEIITVQNLKTDVEDFVLERDLAQSHSPITDNH